MRVEETPYNRITLFDDGIIEATPLMPHIPRRAGLIGGALDTIARLAGSERRPVLWIPTGILPLPPDAWQTIVARVERIVSALAIVVDPEDEPLLGAFPASIDSLLIPARVFNDRADAREWLLQFVDTGEGSG
ncbi:MAG: hypothetical protein GY926_08700 [bacterium]|nr:hypothetical protein [bacterium]MCP4965303.1 hypothetical protein [bacterium]